MSEQQLTPFQTRAERAVDVLLREAGRVIDLREVLSGTIPFYAEGPQTVVHIEAGTLKVWLFSDEANILCGDKEIRFEEPEFGTTDRLQDALIEAIRSCLAGSSDRRGG